MGIEDIQISEELETNAPSIKYRGNEGPKSPQEMQQMMMAELEEEYARYVFEMQEQGIEPMSMQQFMEQAMAEGQMSLVALHYQTILQNQLILFNLNLQDQYYLTDRWQRMVVSWVWMVDVNMV